MHTASFWDRLAGLVGIHDPAEAQTLVRVIQVLVLAAMTMMMGHWVRSRVDRAARGRPSYGEIGPIPSRAAGLLVYILGGTLILAALEANWTLLATVLGAATLGISLKSQDVGRNFVDGIDVFVERPFRLGDRVRIGSAEGRVEEIGVRMTKLRTDDGEQVSIPNNLVFTSVIANPWEGGMERQRLTLKSAALAPAEIEPAVVQALNGLPGVGAAPPAVTVIAAGPDGADLDIGIAHHPHARIADRAIGRLRERFPEATITLYRGPDAS